MTRVVKSPWGTWAKVSWTVQKEALTPYLDGLAVGLPGKIEDG